MTGLKHIGNDCLGEMHRAHDIGIERLADLIWIHLQEFTTAVPARIVSKHREQSQALTNLRHRCLDAPAVGNVRLDGERLSTCGANFLCHRLAGFTMARQ